MNYVDENAEGMPSGRFFVLYRLANRATDHSREDWTCFPSIETQAADTHLSRSAVERHLGDLVGDGWVSRKRRLRPDGKLGIYDYWIHRSPERRAALKAARAAIVATGDKPAETLADLDHPCCKMQHGEGGQPCGDLGPNHAEICGQPCGDLPHEEHKGEHKGEPTQGAREPGDDGFDRLAAVWPESGLKRTKWPQARAAFALAAGLVGAERLIAAAQACAVDRHYARGDYGWPSLQDWLSQERWRAFLTRSGEAGPGSAHTLGDAASRTGFGVPVEIRAAVAAQRDEGFAGSYLDRAQWCDDTRTITAPTTIAFDRLKPLRSLLERHGAQLAPPSAHRGN